MLCTLFLSALGEVSYHLIQDINPQYVPYSEKEKRDILKNARNALSIFVNRELKMKTYNEKDPLYRLGKEMVRKAGR